jgi:hypothetical protein
MVETCVAESVGRVTCRRLGNNLIAAGPNIANKAAYQACQAIASQMRSQWESMGTLRTLHNVM